MSPWVLILMLGLQYAPVTIDMPSREVCERARLELRQNREDGHLYTRSVCVGRSNEPRR